MLAVFVAAVLAALLLPISPTAAAHSDIPDRFSEQAFWTAENTECIARDGTSRQAQVGVLYPVTPPAPTRFYDSPVAAETERLVWLNEDWCSVPTGFMTDAIGGELDPGAWDRVAIIPGEGTGGSGLVALDVLNGLFNGPPSAFEYPSRAAPRIQDLDTGEALLAADWVVAGTGQLTGPSDWTPIAAEGLVGWVPSAALVDTPVMEFGDLTSTITLTTDVSVRSLPAEFDRAELTTEIAQLTAGTTIAISPTPWASWVAVDAGDGRIGWVGRDELTNGGDKPGETTDPTADPDAEATEGPGSAWLDDVRERGEDYLDEREQADKAASPTEPESWWDRISGRENPVTTVIARGQLYAASAIALLAALLAGAGVAAGAATRRRGVAAAASLVTGGAIPLVALLAVPAGVAMGLYAASAAPSTQFRVQVLAGAAVLGLVLAAAVAQRIGALRGVPWSQVAATARQNTTIPLLAGAGVAVGVWLMFSATAPVLIVAGLVVAGAATALMACPEPTLVDDDVADPAEDVVPEATEQSGW